MACLPPVAKTDWVSKGTLAGILAAEYASGVQNSYIEDHLNEDPPPACPQNPLPPLVPPFT